VTDTFAQESPLSVRVNTLKADRDDIVSALTQKGIKVVPVSWYPDALILEGTTTRELGATEWVRTGQLYIQGISSMLPALVLDPRPKERILDMCAAPGSKASQISALTRNAGGLVCVENIRKRYYRLRSVLDLLGATDVRVKLTDARHYHTRELFDRVLVDAPCSSEGRFKAGDVETFAYWSLRKIREMQRKQRGLLMHVARLLKKDGVLVYATCTFAPEENEEVVDWLVRKTAGAVTVVPVTLKDVATYPALQEWEGRTLDPQVRHCVRILPTRQGEGFFIARMIRKD